MPTQKEITTSTSVKSVAAKTSAVAGKKTAVPAAAKVTGARSPVAAKKKATAKETAKETPVQAKPRVARKSAAAKPAAPTAAKTTGKKATITGEERQRLIGEAAYWISVKRPSWTGSPEIDWVQAEAVIDMIFDVND